MSSSLYRNYYSASAPRSTLGCTKEHTESLQELIPHYEYSGTLGDKSASRTKFISIPSIFYGKSIKKGTMDLKFYITGTLVGQLQDVNRNGELIQSGTPSGSTGWFCRWCCSCIQKVLLLTLVVGIWTPLSETL